MRIEGELSILQAEHTARVEGLQEQLEHVEQKLARSLGNPTKPGIGPTGDIVLTGFADEPRLLSQSIALMELEILGSEHKVERLAKKLEAKQAKMQHFNQSHKEVQPLIESLRLATEERDRLQNLLEEFRQSHRSDIGELKVVQTATPAIDGIRSNGSKLFAAASLGTLFLLIGPTFFREWRKESSPKIENTARLLGLPLLTHVAIGQDKEDSAAPLALRIRARIAN